MKIKKGYILREIAGSWVVVPTGQRVVEFNGLISLSESAAMIWKMLEKGVDKEQQLTAMLQDNYNVSPDTADMDVKEFMENLTEKGFIEQ